MTAIEIEKLQEVMQKAGDLPYALGFALYVEAARKTMNPDYNPKTRTLQALHPTVLEQLYAEGVFPRPRQFSPGSTV